MKNWFFFIMAALAFQCLAATDGSTTLERLHYAEQHYAQPADPLHNEQLYIAALEDVLSDTTLTETDKMRPRILLERAVKNRIGSLATDLELTTRDGDVISLSQLPRKFTLLFFNDPDCDACHILKNRLDTTQVINNYVNSDLLQIVGIYPYGDQQRWCATSYPNNVINLWDEKQQIEDEERYILPSIPLFYLLNADGKVLVKNEASLNRVLHALERIMISSDRSTEGLLRLLYNP